MIPCLEFPQKWKNRTVWNCSASLPINGRNGRIQNRWPPTPKASALVFAHHHNTLLLKELNELSKSAISFYPTSFVLYWSNSFKTSDYHLFDRWWDLTIPPQWFCYNGASSQDSSLHCSHNHSSNAFIDQPSLQPHLLLASWLVWYQIFQPRC